MKATWKNNTRGSYMRKYGKSVAYFLFIISFLSTFLVFFLALYYETFQCGWKNIFTKSLKKKFCPQKLAQKSNPKRCMLQLGGFFFLYSPACPKQPRTSFPFWKILLSNHLVYNLWFVHMVWYELLSTVAMHIKATLD